MLAWSNFSLAGHSADWQPKRCNGRVLVKTDSNARPVCANSSFFNSKILYFMQTSLHKEALACRAVEQCVQQDRAKGGGADAAKREFSKPQSEVTGAQNERDGRHDEVLVD